MTKENQAARTAWIEIARPGRFQDSGGAWHEFTAGRLAAMAAGYDPASREAPLVLGHPETDGPAHGWIKALKWNGRKLLAQAAYVTDAVREAVDNGLYKYVSMSLYGDGGLRHVGLLGAVPPAIGGLAPARFSGEAALTLEMKGKKMEELQRKVGELEAKLAAAVQEKEAALKKLAELEAKLGEAKGEAEKTKTEAEKTAAEFAAYKGGQEQAALTARLDGLVKAGKLTPAERPAAERTALALRVSNFSAGAGEETPLEGFLKSLEAREGSPLLGRFSAPAGGDEAAARQHKPLSAKL